MDITLPDENSKTKIDLRICETAFKLRYANHKKSFNHIWESLGTHQAYNTNSKRCSLCLNEKLKITLHRNKNMLKNKFKS